MSTITTQSVQRATRPRIHALDVARGVAILGTLATNIWLFSHPGGMLGYLGHPTTPGASGVQQGIERTLMALANGKFLGLLTLMFGIGLVIQAESAARRGRRWPGGYPVRMALLFVEGLLHYLLIAEFDVLMGYAVTGAIVAVVILRTPRVRRIWAVLAGLVHLLLVTLATAAVLAVGGQGGGAADPGEALYRDGSWWDLVLLRVDYAVVFRIEPVFIGCLTFVMFLVGAELYRRGIFDDRGRVLRARLMAAAVVAFVVDLGLAVTVPDTVLLSRYLLAPIVAGGLLSGIAIVARDGGGRIGRLLAPVGRMALSCYIGQNLVCSALFYGWGLGLNAVAPADRLWVTLGVYAVVCVAMIGCARWWLGRFSQGPVEWAWHRAYAALAR
ncbi:MAG: DUF418 domain-containing protein [Propionibacteriaceae bacterium]|nr:DUF418 domain-containing protein [Propionibacteriaceae bacterium]